MWLALWPVGHGHENVHACRDSITFCFVLAGKFPAFDAGIDRTRLRIFFNLLFRTEGPECLRCHFHNLLGLHYSKEVWQKRISTHRTEYGNRDHATNNIRTCDNPGSSGDSQRELQACLLCYSSANLPGVINSSWLSASSFTTDR
jgi:hypothetical protein